MKLGAEEGFYRSASPRIVMRFLSPLPVLLLVLLAGCAESSPNALPGQPGTFQGTEGAFILGRVVDIEIVPLDGVTVAGGDLNTLTDPNGTFRLGPFDAGTNVGLRAEKPGYAPAEVDTIAMEDQPTPIVMTLVPVASSVPYYETVPHVAFIDCAWAGSPGSLPCNPIDRQLGTNFTNDQSQWFFKIPGPNLAAMLHEATWQANTLGRDMRFLLFHPDLVSGSAVGGDPYLDSRGGSPDRSWLIPGEEAERASAAFNGNESFDYQALYRPWTTNSTIPGWAVYAQHRVENFYTFFYHRVGRDDFTVLPDE